MQKNNRDIEKKLDEVIDFTEPGSVETEELQYDKRTRRTGFYILTWAFVMVAISCLVYAFVTNNEKLIERILFLFMTIMGWVLGYYFGKKE